MSQPTLCYFCNFVSFRLLQNLKTVYKNFGLCYPDLFRYGHHVLIPWKAGGLAQGMLTPCISQIRLLTLQDNPQPRGHTALFISSHDVPRGWAGAWL